MNIILKKRWNEIHTFGCTIPAYFEKNTTSDFADTCFLKYPGTTRIQAHVAQRSQVADHVSKRQYL